MMMVRHKSGALIVRELGKTEVRYDWAECGRGIYEFTPGFEGGITAEAWCREQFGPPGYENGRWRIDHDIWGSILILNDTDATAFRLRWC